MARSSGTDRYIAAEIYEAIARAPDLAELGVEVTVSGDQVYLDGEVATQERCREIGGLVERLLPDHRVHNRLAVTEMPEPGREERIG